MNSRERVVIRCSTKSPMEAIERQRSSSRDAEFRATFRFPLSPDSKIPNAAQKPRSKSQMDDCEYNRANDGQNGSETPGHKYGNKETSYKIRAADRQQCITGNPMERRTYRAQTQSRDKGRRYQLAYRYYSTYFMNDQRLIVPILPIHSRHDVSSHARCILF